MTTPPLTRRAALSFAGLMVAGPLVLTACGKSDDAAPTADVGSPAAVTSIDGRQVSLPAAGKPTAVFFFSVGCGECVGGVRSLGEAAASAEANGTGAGFLAVDMDPRETKETIEGFMKYVEAERVPAAIDQGATLSQRFDVAALSTLIIVDSDGRVTFRATDPDAETIIGELEKAGA
ncbi:redoxin family protein [Brevibacterium casei]|uniref:TlpA family protein disulfide reductase n=1 Tax=Brevibacterium casei TaxID=33889 RepID=UPI0021AE40A5|nr:redoxin family protein [Brevibacterium casei]MCT1764909.1 redoxin family protein [Brevibacterium casei]